MFAIPYRVKNVGGWLAKGVTTTISYPEQALRLNGKNSTTTPPIDGGREVSANFRLQASAPGNYDLPLAAQGRTGGSAGAGVTVTVTPDEDVRAERFWALLALVLALGTLPLVPYGKVLRLIRGRRLSN